MYIKQYLLDTLCDFDFKNKVLVIYGPRQIGKTTLLDHYLKVQKKYLLLDGEDTDVQHHLSTQSITKLKSFIGDHNLLVIDEAQKIPNIGINLKLIIDHCKDTQVIATGSSAFDLANHLGEPLTGRKITFKLFPLSQIELGSLENLAETRANLENRLTYGSYPEVILANDNIRRKLYLEELVSDYLYKDILAIEGLRKPKKIIQLLELIAFQIGKMVSLHELGQQLGLHKDTVEYYLDLLEKTFILINVRGFSRNLRKEITKKSRYYFYDVGVRNAIINSFSPLSKRNDVGELWENYIIAERIKKQSYQFIFTNNYFWRTYEQQEIDWIEERDGQLFAYEFKWQPTTKTKPPPQWLKAYPDATFKVIHQENYLDFIT